MSLSRLILISESDLFVMLCAFLCCLFWALEFGILVGVFVQVLFILYNTARPNLKVEQEQVRSNQKGDTNSSIGQCRYVLYVKEYILYAACFSTKLKQIVHKLADWLSVSHANVKSIFSCGQTPQTENRFPKFNISLFIGKTSREKKS